ncbi:unnamed protein product [Didymodactylos carnosus]|uniref:thioredoxin-dependent peroxiredoxin n=1 Tax=Didymodactylos carnosus TaxID=1234261 RepID=A0A8S2T874_9BILA|nr:unnamed protein product [Didymodactylos carnosus]CAF4276046.1 unnamed protein product [Didymodactylos carnosus]
MSLKLGDQFPNFKLKTTIGDINLHEWMGDKWCLFCSHPADYTPVCTTELSRAAQLTPEFTKRNVKVIGLSCDSVENHHGWIKDLQSMSGCDNKCDFPFPIIDDSDRKLAKELGMIDPDEFDNKGLPLTARALVRLIDALQTTSKYPVATPVDWKVGEKVMIPPSVKEEDIKKHWPQGVETKQVPSGKSYLRMASVN